MNLLLDTHSFVWWDSNRAKLSHTAYAALQDENNSLFVSDASIWEIQIKSQLGRLRLDYPLVEMVRSQTGENAIKVLQISTKHILHLNDLPFHHKDPFDRLLAAQALIETLTFVSLDDAFDAYGVTRLW